MRMFKAGDVVKLSKNAGFYGCPLPAENEIGTIVLIDPNRVKNPKYGLPYLVKWENYILEDVLPGYYFEDLELVTPSDKKQILKNVGTKWECIEVE
jgi:hypothetical protein